MFPNYLHKLVTVLPLSITEQSNLDTDIPNSESIGDFVKRFSIYKTNSKFCHNSKDLKVLTR